MATIRLWDTMPPVLAHLTAVSEFLDWARMCLTFVRGYIREEGWRVAAALCARHIGGAVNYVGVVETLGVSAASQVMTEYIESLVCLRIRSLVFNI
eukprot:scaffold128082_cov22-Prasinocladus_malaysianus.AAC.1